MLKVYLLVSLLAGSALANGWGHRHRSWDRWDEDANEVKPPNCSCSWEKEKANKTETGNSSKIFGKWMTKFLKPNETIAQFEERMEKRKMVCATNNVTYANMCEFINNASANPALGKRCHGPCPCDFKEEENSSRPDFMKMPICLNNGLTVYGRQALESAVKANDSLGTRCFGECSECSTDLKCPRRHGKEMRKDHHRHHRESNVTAPDCTCTLSDSPWFQKFLNTSCGRKFLEKRQVCGSDNVTYANKCEFKNNQTKNPALGKRCHGACPCDFESHKKFGHFGRRSHHNSSSGEHKEMSRRFDWKRFPKPVCLNNGTTLYQWRETQEALKADSNLGVRCKGECSECQSAPIKCPVDWVKLKQEEEKNRPKPPNCKCPKALQMGFGKHRRHEICGNDNKTYANICELVNNQSSQPTLGFRCLGQCPCRNHSEKIDEIQKSPFDESENEEDHEKPEDSEESSPQMDEASQEESHEVNQLETVNQQSNIHEENFQENEEDFENEDDFVVSENESREKRNADWSRGRHHRRHHGHHRRHSSVCLTNGQTVKGWKNISEIFAADPSIGIRCRGHCEFCANITRCPWFPSAEKQKEIKENFRKMMQEKGRKWLEMTMESEEKPGNCDCSFGFHKKNQTSTNTTDRHLEGHHGGHRGWRHHGGHGKMDFSVCGTNNVTFKTMCELVNNQSFDKNLGFRCHGACPCPVKDQNEIEENQKEENSTELNNFKKYLEAHGSKFAFCLTNGITVYTKKDLVAALASNKELGTRYMNECSAGDAGLKCPRVFRPRNESMENKWGHHNKQRRHDDRKEFKGRKWSHGEQNNTENVREIGLIGKKFGHRGEHNEAWKEDNRTAEQRHQDWQLKKHSPSFEFKKAFDFGFDFDFGMMGGHHGRWGKGHHGMSSRRHHRWGHSCMNDDEDNKSNSTQTETVAV